MVWSGRAASRACPLPLKRTSSASLPAMPALPQPGTAAIDGWPQSSAPLIAGDSGALPAASATQPLCRTRVERTFSARCPRSSSSMRSAVARYAARHSSNAVPATAVTMRPSVRPTIVSVSVKPSARGSPRCPIARRGLTAAAIGRYHATRQPKRPARQLAVLQWQVPLRAGKRNVPHRLARDSLRPKPQPIGSSALPAWPRPPRIPWRRAWLAPLARGCAATPVLWSQGWPAESGQC